MNLSLFRQRIHTFGSKRRGRRFLPILILFLLMGSGGTAFGEFRVYRERAQGLEYVNTYQIQENGSGFFVTIVSRLGEQLHIQKKLWLDNTYATLKWSYEDFTENIDISAFREGNTIRLEGVDRGKHVEKIYEIDSLPWKQQIPLDLERFAKSNQNSMLFWAIGTNGPADMRIAKFIATKRGNDPILINGEDTEAVCVRVSLAGLLSLIWHGDSWHRLSDGMFMLFDSSAAPGYPPTVVELISGTR
jgi:hypothetical protein